MWKLLYLAALAALVVAFEIGGTATASSTSRSNAVAQREADMFEIDQIEVKFHRATSTHDIKLMMSLWAPCSTSTSRRSSARRRSATGS